MLLIQIDRNGTRPVYLQVFDAIKVRIEQGSLKPGDRLPSSRRLSEQLGVNRTTIYKAYEELWAQGYIESTPGSYSFVRKRVEIVEEQRKGGAGIIPWDEKVTAGTARLLSGRKKETGKGRIRGIDFTPLSPDPDLIPAGEYRKCLNRVMRDRGSNLLQYGDPLGYKPLRQSIAKRMKLHGIHTSEKEVMVVNGIQNGLELVMKVLAGHGSTILVEEPTYSAALPLFSFYGAEVVPVPLDNEGVRLDILEKEVKTKNPAFFYTMPNFHNPSGITSSQDNRENLLKLAEACDLPILEDGFEEEMKYYGKAILPVKSMDRMGWVLYFGTFSKVLFPGLRKGWIVADPLLLDKLGAVKKAGEISGNSLEQAALELFCRLGHYDRHIQRMHKVYRKRMKTAIKAAREHLAPEICRYIQPMGGYTLWVELRDKQVKERAVIEQLQKQEVAVSPGSLFFTRKPPHASFRISIAHRREEEIREGMRRIGRALTYFSQPNSNKLNQ